jgi:hypothetical protein
MFLKIAVIKMELKFRCGNCRKKLDFFEVHFLKGETIVNLDTGFSYNTGKNYWKDCYEDMIGEKFLKNKI